MVTKTFRIVANYEEQIVLQFIAHVRWVLLEDQKEFF
jgi:hypothetical protein